MLCLLSLLILNRFGTQAKFIIGKWVSKICQIVDDRHAFLSTKMEGICPPSKCCIYFLKKSGILIDCSFTLPAGAADEEEVFLYAGAEFCVLLPAKSSIERVELC